MQRGPQAVRAVTEDSTSSTGCSGNKLPELDMAHRRALPRPRPRHRADRAEQPGPLSSRPRPAPPASPSCGTGGQHGCARGGGSRGCRPSPRSQLKSESHLSTPPPLTKQVTWPVPCPPPQGREGKRILQTLTPTVLWARWEVRAQAKRRASSLVRSCGGRLFFSCHGPFLLSEIPFPLSRETFRLPAPLRGSAWSYRVCCTHQPPDRRG